MARTIHNLVEVDTLEAIVIIDNEIDILSSVAPNTIINSGRMPNLSLAQPDHVQGRGEATKEMPMEAICCLPRAKAWARHRNIAANRQIALKVIFFMICLG